MKLHLNRIAAALVAIMLAGAVAFAANNWTGTNNAGTTITFCSKDIGSGVEANCVVPVEGTTGLSAIAATSYHANVTATSGGMTINVKNSAGLVTGIQIVNTTTTLGDFRLINSASAPTCSSATGVIKNIPIQSNATSAGIVLPTPIYMSTGISFCYTGAVSDTDSTTPTAGTWINIDYN